MNERIKELALQARKYAQQYVNESVIPYGKTASEFERIFESKFAELIVEECANAIVNDGRLSDVRSAANGCVRTIKQHFGVE